VEFYQDLFKSKNPTKEDVKEYLKNTQPNHVLSDPEASACEGNIKEPECKFFAFKKCLLINLQGLMEFY
jgi:hypothetical protein